MRRLLINAIVLVMLMVDGRGIRAQEPPKWPPDPDTLFAEGVEVVSVTEELPYGLQRMPTTESRCGRIFNGNAAAAVVKRDEQFYICDMATGKLSQPISYGGYMPAAEEADGRGLNTSPDGKWVLFEEAKNGVSEYNLIAYELATGRFNNLGRIPQASGYETQFGWATNVDWYFIIDGYPEWSSTYAFVATVTTEQSMQVALENMRLPVVYFDDPPRLEAWFTPTNSSGYYKDGFDCELSVYYFLTHSTTIYHTGNPCIPEYGKSHGDGYYRDVQPDGKAWLMRFNPITRERKNLYYGEMERLYWVSDDEAYALVMLDDNGKINCMAGYESADGYDLCFYDIATPMLAVVELNTGRILYSLVVESYLADHWPWEVFGYENAYVKAVDERSIVIKLKEANAKTFPQDPLIRIVDGVAKVDMLDGALTEVIDSQHLILEMADGSDALQYVLYDIKAHSTTPITIRTADYLFAFDKVHDGAVDIVVYPRKRSMASDNAPETITYTVNLPF